MESPLSPSSHSSAKNLGQGAASSSSSSSNCHHRPPNGLDFVPPFRFALVEDGLYRGAYPTLRNFPFLSTLGLKTIVSLTPEEATYDLKEFCKSEGIQHRHISAERHKGDPQLLPTDLNDALHLLVNADLHPLYLHCLDGRHVTGLVVMALRKLLQWDYPSGQLEYQKFTRETKDETAFVMDYSGGLTLPLRIPKWFWSGSWQDQEGRLKRHPTLKFKYPAVQPLSTTKGSSTIRSLVPVSLDGSLDRTLNSPSRSSTGAGTPTNSSNGAAAAAVKSYVDVAAIPPLYVSANCFNHRTTTATPLTSSNPLATADPPTAAPKKSSSVLVRRGNSPHNQQTQPQQQLVPSQLNPTPQPSLTLTGGSVVLSSSVAAATASAVYDLLPGSRLQQQPGGSKGPTSVGIVSSSAAAADLSSLGSGGASASPPSSSQQQQPPSSQHGGCCGHTVAVIPNGTAQATDVQSWSVRTSLCVPKGFVTLDELMGVTDLAVIAGGASSGGGGGGGSMTFAGSPLTESLSQDQVALRMLATPSAPFPLLLQKHHHLHVLSATSQDKSRSRKQRSLSV